MADKQIYKNLNIILENSLNKIDLIQYLMNVLSLEREAVVRRLKGIVSFDIDELYLLSRGLGVSLDSVIWGNDKERAIFSLNLLDTKIVVDKYSKSLLYYTSLNNKVSAAKESYIIASYNSIPISFITPYEFLSKFRLYKWLYQSNFIEGVAFSKFKVPKELGKIIKEYKISSENIKNKSYVLDKEVFISFAKTIYFFYEMELISKEEINKIKDELLLMIDSVWDLSTKDGINIYLSNISINSTYLYYESDDFKLAHIKMFDLSSIETQNPKLCLLQKKSIQSIINHSTKLSGDKKNKVNHLDIQKEEVAKIFIL
ncbi:MAG: hypothetical protein H6Q15_1382 [Bacteroidetes bacterium]|nr:hypothetical protein [Bacteroidota bacterium]